MGSYAALAHTTWVGAHDFTADTNATSLRLSREPLDSTTFGVGRVGRSRVAGLASVESSVDGFWQAGAGQVDDAVIAALGGAVQVVTQTVDGTEGCVAYMYQAREIDYTQFGPLGQLVPFTLGIQGAKGAAGSVGAPRGRLLVAKGTISSTGVAGSVVQAGAVAAGQFLYCAVHCFAIGTSFTLQVQSDDAANFSSPTTRMTIGSITAADGYWGTRVAGPITDDHWRVNVSAASGTSTIAVSIGIK